MEASVNRNLLIISQLGWPPEFGAQILRLSKIAKYLSLFNVHPVIITPHIHPKSLKDEELMRDVTKYGMKIYHIGKQLHPSLNKAHLAKAFKLFFVPDLKMYYFMNIKKILKIIKNENLEYLFTSTPPSGHIIGYMIKRELGNKIKWIADFADPWTLNHFYFSPTPLHKLYEEVWEKKIIKTADAITFASEYQMEKYLYRYQTDTNIKAKSYWIPNGFDEEEFSDLKPKKFNKYTFLYMGTIYREFDLSFLKIFKKLENEGYDFQILFLGNIAPTKYEEIKNININCIKVLGRRQRHKEVLQYLISADALIFSMMYDYVDVLPSRLPEYLRAEKPIIAFVNPISYAAKIISTAYNGFIAKKSNSEETYTVIKKLINHNISINARKDYISKFSWINISKKLSKIISEFK